MVHIEIDDSDEQTRKKLEDAAGEMIMYPFILFGGALITMLTAVASLDYLLRFIKTLFV